MPDEFRMTHRVAFADTDMAGIMHFAAFFRYMEATEHAFFRSLGLSVNMDVDGRRIGWPRVRVECEYRRPLRFEEEFDVHLRVREKKAKSITYDFVFSKNETGTELEVARGSVTTVCVAMDEESGSMKATTVPAVIADLIQAVPEG